MIFRRWITTLAACALATAAARADEPPLKQAFAQLLPGIGAEHNFEQPQQRWQELCWKAGAPGHEAERAEACKLMAAKLGPETPARARIWLLKELERIGMEESVDAVAAAIHDPDRLVRDAALRALTNLPVPAAGAKLRATLEAAKDDDTKVALLNALGYRREDANAALLSSELQRNLKNRAVATAAARALGKLPFGRGSELLASAAEKAPAEVRPQVADAFARQVQRRLKSGDTSALYRATGRILYRLEGPARLAGLVILLRTDPERSAARILDVLSKDDPAEAMVALGYVAHVKPDGIKTLADGLSSLPQPAQVALLRALGPRRERAALPAVVEATRSANPDVKVAALAALGGVGDASTVPLLLTASHDGGKPADAARRSLETVFADGVDEALVSILNSTSSTLGRARLIEILDHRRAASAVPALIAETQIPDADVRRRAFAALGNVASPGDVPGMVRSLLKTTDAGEREEAARAVAQVCSRNADPDRQAEPVLAAYREAKPADQIALLAVLGQVGGSKALAVVREAVAGSDAARRAGGVEALHRWPDGSVADDLAKLVETTTDAEQKQRLIHSLVRVVTMQGGRPDDEKLALLTRAMTKCDRDEERRLILDRARDVPTFATVKFLAPYLDNPKTAGLACATIVEILHRDELRDQNRAATDAVLDKVISIAKDRSLKERARSFKSKP